jgi:hypothetical protein
MPDVMKTVGRYEILREVGRGGMAMVYLARQTDLDRFVALKELGAFHASDPSFAQRFLRESRVAGSLSHPNIVTVHDYFEHEGTPYIAMEYVERGSLRPYVGRLTLAQIGGVLEGLLAGLTHAEENGIVHRDLKPENLMVTSDGRVKIADFGIAKATTKMQTGAFLTATGTTVGTPTYMAPEQAMAQEIGPWTDLYSVGCMAFELFTGNVPFHDSEAPMAILLRHVNEPIAPIKSIVPDADQGISDWVEKLLVKEPTQRTQNANDAWDSFEEIMLGLAGPRWRRSARLVERVEDSAGAKPLTPAPFAGTTTDDAASEEFKSFAWGQPGTSETGAPAAAAPPMYTPPPGADSPSIPEPITGPDTPIPAPAQPAQPELAPAPGPASAEPIAETGFVTFGLPAPSPPTDALIAPPAAATPPPVEAAAPPAAAPVEPAPPAAASTPTPAPVEAAPPGAFEEPPEGHAPGFHTYIAPPPSRPPTSEPPLVPAPAEAASAPPPPPVPVAVPVAETIMPSSLPRPEPAPAWAPPAKDADERGGRGWIFPAALVGGIVVAAVIGLLAGGSGGGKKAPPVSNVPTLGVAGSGMSLKVPAGWSRPASAPTVPGLSSSAVAVAGPSGGTVVFGKADKTAANSTLLPDGLRKGSVPTGGPVALGGDVQAIRYKSVPIGGGHTATVYAVPTSGGVDMLACVPAAGGAAAFAATCDAVATTVRLTGDKALPVGPSKDYATSLSGALGTLGKATGSGSAALAKAKTRLAQAQATDTLATAYAAAAKSLSGASLGPADTTANENLVTALTATAAAYKQAAKEARSKDAAGFKRESANAAKAQTDVNNALAGLKAVGYDVKQS